MFVVGLVLVGWMLRRPDRRKLVLAKLNGLILSGGYLLYHDEKGAEFDRRMRDWHGQVGGLLVLAFDDSVVAEWLGTEVMGGAGPMDMFSRELDQLTLIRDRFQNGEIPLKPPSGQYLEELL